MDGDVKESSELLIKFADLQSEIYEHVKKIVEHYQEGDTTKEELLPVKAYYYKKKYLFRIVQQLNGKL